jgi:hypothetical protein
MQDYSPVEMHVWRFYYKTKKENVQLQSTMCSICGNYYHNGSIPIRNGIGFNEKIMCRCEFDYGDDMYDD